METNETCRRGHVRTPENVYEYVRKNGQPKIMCRVCNRLMEKKRLPPKRVKTERVVIYGPPRQRGRPRKEETKYPRRGEKKSPRTNGIYIFGPVTFLLMPCGREAMIDTSDIPSVVPHGLWSAGGKGYVHKQGKWEDGSPRTVFLHRLVAQAPKGYDVDHINGDPLDNRRKNLRVTTRSENLQNTRTTGRKSASGHKNVYPVRRQGNAQWYVKLMCQGISHYGGEFNDLTEAVTKASQMRRAFHTHCVENSLPLNG